MTSLDYCDRLLMAMLADGAINKRIAFEMGGYRAKTNARRVSQTFAYYSIFLCFFCLIFAC